MDGWSWTNELEICRYGCQNLGHVRWGVVRTPTLHSSPTTEYRDSSLPRPTTFWHSLHVGTVSRGVQLSARLIWTGHDRVPIVVDTYEYDDLQSRPKHRLCSRLSALFSSHLFPSQVMCHRSIIDISCKSKVSDSRSKGSIKPGTFNTYRPLSLCC